MALVQTEPTVAFECSSQPPNSGCCDDLLNPPYAPDAVVYEPDAIATGHDAIAHAVEALLTSLPPDFVFTAIGPAVGHHGLGRLRWRAGPPEGPVAVTGTDVVRLEDGRIHSLHVFLDPVGA
jgi:hypothetical protein